MANKDFTSDRELLEMAAKAAGIEIKCVIGDTFWTPDGITWNPLAEDGDEARLEAALGLWVSWYPSGVECGSHPGREYMEYFDQHNGDKQSARRRAGVRAAASIGAAL